MARKMKEPSVTAPQNEEEANQYLAELAKQQRAIDEIEADLNKRVDQLKAKAAEKVVPLEAKIQDLVQGLHIYAAANRATITQGGKRSLRLSAGIIGWRRTPPAVSLKGVPAVIEAIQALGLNHFLRVKTEVDKEAMLKEPAKAEAIEGVTISQKEEFFIKPAELKLDLTLTGNKVKKTAA